MSLVAEVERTAADVAPPSGVARRERTLADWILLAAVGCFAALALPFLRGQVYVADDLGEFHLPLRAFYSQQLADGGAFDWMPSLYGGFYVTAEGQLGAYHPLHLLLYRWLPLGAAFDLELLISYPCLFAGTYFFLKRWLPRRDAALFAALAFTFGGFNLLHFVHPNAIAIVAHLPWLLLAIELSLTAPRGPRRATAQLSVALLTASQLLIGYPQYVWFSLLLEAAYAVWRMATLRVGWKQTSVLAWSVAVGCLIGAVQWLPTLDALRHSTRSTIDAAFANSGSLHPLNLVQFVAPYLFQSRVVGQNTHELGLYCGAAPLLLVVWLLSQRRHWGRATPLVRASLAVAVVALLLACGEFGGLYRVQQFLPVVGHFRFPCRAIVLVQLALATSAAVAFGMLSTPTENRDALDRRRGDRALLLTVALSLLVAAIGPRLWPAYAASAALVWCGPLLVAAGAALVALAQRHVRGALVVLVAFTAIDLSGYGLSYSVWNRTADLRFFAAAVPPPPGATRPRVVAEESGGLRTGNRMLLAGVVRVDGYAGLEPVKRLDYATHSARARAGVQFVHSNVEQETQSPLPWTPLADTAPRARLVTRIVPLTDVLDGTAHLGSVSVDGDVTLSGGAPGAVSVVSDVPGHVVVECRAPTRQLLVLTESYHHGWVARVDGRIEPIVQVDGDFLGCVVGPGTHTVDLKFRPRSLLVGRLVSLGGLGLLLCTFAVAARRPRCDAR